MLLTKSETSSRISPSWAAGAATHRSSLSPVARLDGRTNGQTVGRSVGLTGRAHHPSIIQSSYLHQRTHLRRLRVRTSINTIPRRTRETISPIGLLYFGPRRKLFRAAALNLSLAMLETSFETNEYHLTGDFYLQSRCDWRATKFLALYIR